jgi:hypothetical protein
MSDLARAAPLYRVQNATSGIATTGLTRAIERLAVPFAVLVLAVSPFALNALGWNYDGGGGSGPTRFHPASFLGIILFVMVLLRSGNPLLSFIRAMQHDPFLALFLVGWFALFFHAVQIQKLPAAALVDTFLLPALLLIIVRSLNGGAKHRLAMVIHLVFFLNAIIGIGEFVTSLRLTPYIAGGLVITDDWRSTALLGHPLGNALMTGCYTALLLLGGGRELKGTLRISMILLQFMAMVAFGGRASLVLLVLFGLFGGGRAVMLFLAGARLRLFHLTLIMLCLPIGLGIVGALTELGYFDKFIYRFIEDKGSANARIVMFELFKGFTPLEILFGPPQNQLEYLVKQNALEFGIESLWVAFILYYGLIPSLIFFTGLFCFVISITAECRPQVLWVFGYFFLVNTTFLGLGGKTITFANLCLQMLILMPRFAHDHASSILAGYGTGDPSRKSHPC